MIQLIAEDLRKHKNLFNGYKLGGLNLKAATDKLAMNLISAIEAAGMSPPLSIEKMIGFDGYRTIEGWEQEDE